ncbi:hypothetical protein BER92_14755 [Xanthomonas fragariae]|nr:hypothetical protein BER92_14755 [Xanthomonas fragariae]
MALAVTQAVSARLQAEFALWLQQAENAIDTSLRGDQIPEDLADAAVCALCDTLDAQVGALYRIDGERLRLISGAALPNDAPKTDHFVKAHCGTLQACNEDGDVVFEARLRRHHLAA